MKLIIRLAVVVGLVLALSVTGVSGWIAGAVVAAALVLEVGSFWRALTTRNGQSVAKPTPQSN